jgi:prevent-host-death family protein
MEEVPKMATFNVAEAKTHFSALIQRALMGEEVIIARGNKPVLRLVPLKETWQPRQPGSARGEMWLAEDFEDTPEDFKGYQ